MEIMWYKHHHVPRDKVCLYVHIVYNVQYTTAQVDSYLSASIAYTIIYRPTTILYLVDVNRCVFLPVVGTIVCAHSCSQLFSFCF